MGGETDKNNIVKLTAKEHFLCHLLLTKMFEDKLYKMKANYAFYQMSNKNHHREKQYRVTSHLYDYGRKMCSVARKLSVGTRTHSDKTKQKMSVSALSLTRSDTHKQKLSDQGKLISSTILKSKEVIRKRQLTMLSKGDAHHCKRESVRKAISLSKKGTMTVYNIIENTYELVTSAEFKMNKGVLYVGMRSKLVPKNST
jgi:hypothetical protein